MDLFNAILGFSEMTFAAPRRSEHDSEASGVGYEVDIGDALWTMDAKILPINIPADRKLAGILADLPRNGGTFYGYDPRRTHPRLDLRGTTLGSASVAVQGYNLTASKLQLKGLPSGYTLSRGDLLSFDYGGNRYLHEVAGGDVVVASGAGITGWFALFPPLKVAVPWDTAVTLIKATAEFALVPGSVSVTTSGVVTRIAFKAKQVLRNA